jgi:hypothetical protein
MNDETDEDFGNDDHGHHEENESCRVDSVGIRQLLFRIEALVHTGLSSMNVAQVKRRVIYESKR